jgi:chitinase
MRLRCWFFFLVFATVAVSIQKISAQDALANHLSKRIVADYGYWSKYQTPPYSHAQIPYHMLTHINHAGLSFDDKGNLLPPDPGGLDAFIEPELNEEAHARGVKVLLLLGGDFNGLETSGAVQTLVDNIKAFENEHHYDGVDMDWEYPATTTDRKFLVELMDALRKSNPDYTLSIDVAPWGGYGYDLKHLQLSTNYFNIMMYDCAGPWDQYGQLNSPIFWDYHDPAPWECQPGGSVQDATDIFLKNVPARQLTMGTPFYGYYYTAIKQLFAECPAWVLNNPNNGDTCGNSVLTVNYGPDVKHRINKDGWHTQYDPIAYVPYMLKKNGDDGYITYDDAFSTYFRVWYSDWDRGLGGTFMWSLDADYDGHSQDLLNAMYTATVTGP